MISISLSPEEFTAKSHKLAAEQGIHLTGDEGTIAKSGVKAQYKYADGELHVTILEKPFFVSTQFCEDQLRQWLDRGSV